MTELNMASFLLGLVIGLIGMAVQSYVWAAYVRRKRTEYEERSRRKDRILGALFEELNKRRSEGKNERGI